MASEVMGKLEKLEEKYVSTHFVEQIRQWKAEARQAIALTDLKSHDGIKLLLNVYHEEVININKILITRRELTLEERDLLFEKRDWCEELLGYFEQAQSIINNAEQFADNELEENDNN